MNSDNEKAQAQKALVMLLLGGLAIGFAPILARMSEVGPISTAFWRGVFALFLLAGIHRARMPRTRQGNGSGWEVLLQAGLPGVLLAGDLATWHLSLTMTSVANATLLVNISPIFVAIASWAILRQPVHRNVLWGLVTAITGIIVLKGGLAGLADGDQWKGDAVALTAALFLSGYMILMTQVRGKYSTLTVMLASTITMTCVLLPLAWFIEPDFLPRTWYGWMIVAVMGVLCHVIGQGFIAYSLAFLPAAFSSLTLLIQPVIAAILAWIILHEPVSVLQACGGILVLFGIVIARRQPVIQPQEKRRTDSLTDSTDQGAD